MAEVTKSLLSKYYGFGSGGCFEKSLSSHTGRDSLEILPDEIEVLNSSKQHQEDSENIIKDNLQKGDESTANKSDVKNLLDEQEERSSRVLSEETLMKEDTCDENYEIFLETNSILNDYVFKNEKSQAKHDESSISIDKSQLKSVEEISDANLAILEETASDIRSTISSPMPKKRLNRKLKTSVMPLKPPPKKVPVCNGVFLDLTSTGISEFPLNMLDKLSNLRMLYLENNNLRELPNELFPSLQLLHWLDVRNNQLTNLPSNIAWHPCLETILLQGNRIESLPLELCQVPKLKGLQTMRNPLVFPPKDIVDRGFLAILDYLRQEWEKLHPEDLIKYKRSNDQEKELGEVPDLTTILCYKPKSILKKKIPEQFPEISSVTSTSSSIDANINEKTVRQKSWDYKPSNRYENEVNNTSDGVFSKPNNKFSVKFLKRVETDVVRNCNGLRSENLYLRTTPVHSQLMKPEELNKNISFANEEQSPKKLRKSQFPNSAFQDLGYIRTSMEETFKESSTKERMFHIITHDRVMMKFYPMQLDSPHWILEFMETYLGMKKK